MSPLVADVTGKSVLVTRYFRALKPPEQLIEDEEPLAAAEKVAWFVSLIPYLPSNALFPGLQVSFFNSSQFCSSKDILSLFVGDLADL